MKRERERETFMFGKRKTQVFLPQPKKLDLEITGLVFLEYLQATFLTAQLASHLLVGLLEQVISRCPNRYLHSILFRDAKENSGNSNFKFLIFHKKLIPFYCIFHTIVWSQIKAYIPSLIHCLLKSRFICKTPILGLSTF